MTRGESKMNRLNKRERIIVAVGVTFVTFFLVYQFVVSPSRDRLGLLERVMPRKEKELSEIIRLKNEYDVLKRSGSQKANRGKGPVTLSYLEDLAEKAGLKKNIRHMKPLGKFEGEGYVEHTMEIRLSKIRMEQLVGFVYDIENTKRSVKIRELSIVTNKKDLSTLDVKIEIASFEST